jgi:hypothetical protein
MRPTRPGGDQHANRSHVPFALQALRVGPPVVVNKPLAARAVEAERLIVASEEAGKLLTVFQKVRWSRRFLKFSGDRRRAAGPHRPIRGAL